MKIDECSCKMSMLLFEGCALFQTNLTSMFRKWWLSSTSKSFSNRFHVYAFCLLGELSIEELLQKYNVDDEYDADEVLRSDDDEESIDEGQLSAFAKYQFNHWTRITKCLVLLVHIWPTMIHIFKLLWKRDTWKSRFEVRVGLKYKDIVLM